MMERGLSGGKDLEEKKREAEKEREKERFSSRRRHRQITLGTEKKPPSCLSYVGRRKDHTMACWHVNSQTTRWVR